MHDGPGHRNPSRCGEVPIPDIEIWGCASRIVVERVTPEVDGGRFAAKRIAGDVMAVEADVYSDGHDELSAALLVRSPGARDWTEIAMRPLGNDRWTADVELHEIGAWTYTVAGWRDPVRSWARDVAKKQAAGQSVDVEFAEGLALLRAAIAALPDGSEERRALEHAEAQAAAPECSSRSTDERIALISHANAQRLLAGRIRQSVAQHPDLPLWVDRKAAAFSTWYELMPRSQSPEAGRHGTFDDVIARLPELESLGFDVLYFTPIHPIGRKNRKGRNNALRAEPDDPGSPYAIGSDEGGHTALHPELGSFDDFARLVEAARRHGMEIALDFAIQCAPDHPWVEEHPEWFERRPDGTIRYAENPPKKYEDIVNVSFYGPAFPAVWLALRDVVFFWVEKGVSIFRVDNPHTKPFPFWEWMIGEVRRRHPEVIFLSEAFTRPKIMRHLAKLGFSQSYSYFTWRNTKAELTEYLEELTQGASREFMRPNFFANTPDINPYYLQTSGRPGFQVRLFLAATLGASYGLYSGFELCEAEPVPGKEEYLNSEKYELKTRDWDKAGHIKADIRLLNRLRHASPSLQSFTGLTFHNAWNENILYYAKSTPDRRDFLLFAVNLDPHQAHGAHFEVPLWEFGLPDDATIMAEDVVLGRQFSWTGKIQHMWLDPHARPYMIWRLLPPGGGTRG